MTMRVTRLSSAPTYEAAAHHGVVAQRLQGREAGPPSGFWIGLSRCLPGGGADERPTASRA